MRSSFRFRDLRLAALVVLVVSLFAGLHRHSPQPTTTSAS